MSPEIIEALKTLEAEIRRIRRAEDLEAVENFRRQLNAILVSGTTEAATDIRKSVNENGSNTYLVADSPDLKIKVALGGSDYYLALYNA